MLVETLIQNTLEMQGFRVAQVQMTHGYLEAVLVPDRRYSPRCGLCGKRAIYRDTRPTRRFRHVPLWGIDVFLNYAPRRISCSRCGGVFTEDIPWASGQRRFTRALMVTLATWARVLTWKQVGRLFRCAWGTVAAAVDEAIQHGLAHRDLSEVTLIGIDEISRKRGHVYVTNVYDLDGRRLIWSGEGRGKDTLREFFEGFGPEQTAKLVGVCCDMWQPYVDVVKEKAPHAILVFDKFHIVQHLSKAVDQVRLDEIREKGASHKELMAKTRYIWLKNPWNLTSSQKGRLAELEKLNLKINRAYLMKEAFRKFWDYRNPVWAKDYLDKWFWWATHSRLDPMRNFAWMIRRRQADVLNYFRAPIDNGAVEGLNNKAKVIIHRAYGFRTAANYIRNLYHCMAELPLPKTMHSFV
ncbi:MAG: ISL3 family transposase [Desulfobulbaceae bacterium]|nr:MAG: ISL3 family transposase [Desulfobulbaceae bacterium]